tara:strand:- start:20454 stop:21173 length:720 start_codon:yes stop_codon:yes gene_type:complete
MKKVDLQTFFDQTGYVWEKDTPSLGVICELTKTRPKEGIEEFRFVKGHEQTFFIKALAEYYGVESFFEIGTGRGTACYALSLLESVSDIVTIDIIPHDEKKYEAINYKPAMVSNSDLYDLIPFEQKKKISFSLRNQIPSILDQKANQFDLCFIDGNHDDPRSIVEDYYVCTKMLKEGGIIIFDDYHPDRFSVKMVVDKILETNPELNSYLILHSGHVFGHDGRATDDGMVVVSTRDLSV